MKRIGCHIVIALGAVLGIWAALCIQGVQAGGVVGPNCSEATLRAALAGGGSVTFNCGGPTLILVFNQFVITQTTSVDGGGQITLYADDNTRLFDVGAGVTLTLRNLTLSDADSFADDGGAIRSDGTLYLENSRIQRGRTDVNHSGGAIFSSGPVFIINSTLEDNYGGSAGAIFINSSNARALVTNSTFDGNHSFNGSVGRGGAIWVGPDASLTVVDSHFISNASRYVGGALAVSQGGAATLTTQNLLSRTTFIGNVVTGNIGVGFPGGSGGAIYSEGALSVNRVDFVRNEAGESTGVGGAIRAVGSGSLDVSASDFDGNRAEQQGGAIDSEVQASITGSTFTQNSARGGGGAIQNKSATASSISSSTFLSNHASDGGALVLYQGALALTNVTVSRNSVDRLGGGIVSFGPLILSNSAVSSNTAPLDGGGIYIGAGTAALANVTLSGNAAAGDGGGILLGEFASAVELNNVTITRNLADSDNDLSGDGGGIRVVGGTLTVRNSIIAGNFDTPNNAGGGVFNPDCSGTLVSQGYNLAGMINGCMGFINGVNGDKAGTAGNPLDPRLGPLANNGGATQTHALLPGSPAFNAGNPLPPGSGGFACAATDQRSVKRPLGPACDMGAFEAGSVLSLPMILR